MIETVLGFYLMTNIVSCTYRKFWDKPVNDVTLFISCVTLIRTQVHNLVLSKFIHVYETAMFD